MDENKDTAGNKTDEELECEKKLINLFRHPSLRDDLISLFIVKMFESVVKRTWITEANGDMNQPIDDWKRYKDDQIAKIEFRNGNVYKGRVSRHVMHGEGEFIWLDGTSYKGSFDTGHITGNGVVTWPTQSWYKGELVKGYRQGNGLLVVPGRLAFAGSWANGVRYGPGLLLQDSEPTRGYCDTTWRRDVCHGLGTRVYPSGAVFHGHWQDGKRHGFGVINWPNGDMYRGDWKNDRMHGLGEFTWSLGAATSHKSSISFQNRYYGTWVDGSRHGIGILETDSGMILKCKWKMDMKHGYGEIICNNGFLLKGDPLFANDHLLDPISNSRHASISTKTCLLNAHFIQKGKKLKKQNVQTHLSCESIDFCYHVDRYMQNKWNLKQFEIEKKLEDESKAVGRFVEFEVKTPKTQLYSGNDSMTNRTFEGCFEEKWLRNIILRNLPLLKKVYFDYATILCKYSTKSWSSKIAIIRLFFWQILRDCKIQLTEKSVAEFDILVKNNHFALLKDHRNPFERLSFFQFLHYLIEISWHLYGKYGERQLKTPGALASALEKFIVADLKQSIGNNSGSVFKDSRNLCFMREIFGLYQSLQSDLTARQLLNAILNWKNNSYLKNVQEMSHDIIKQFDGRDTYAKIKICANQSLENLKKVKSEPAKIMYLAYLDYVNPRIAMKCILQICPRVKTSDRFYNMDYKMTFLELYEILLLCAVECFEFKKKQERRKQAIEIKLSQKPKEERRTSLKKTRVSRDNSAKALKISKKP
ncbi:radial spoke head 10 homolog B isoform X2 [Nilaparvata lugens]|uniref:radial spoke head 10 homolog B isoform X2 n=1 Tax=Nilaparvata lugens TaxID=108931 RepID=UPI00193D30E2|nr:radial spoke head 10 homolog B isoform X2 [Nilaparvata lugens]